MIGAIYTFVMVLLEVGTTGDQQARSLLWGIRVWCLGPLISGDVLV